MIKVSLVEAPNSENAKEALHLKLQRTFGIKNKKNLSNEDKHLTLTCSLSTWS